MDYGNVSRDTLLNLLRNLPQTPDNSAIQSYLQELVAAGTVQAIPYTYTAAYYTSGSNNNLAAGTLNSPVNINVQADADFLVLNQTYRANTANAAVTVSSLVSPNALVSISDTGSGMTWMDQAVPVTSIFGDGKQPFILPEPKLLMAKATIQVLVSNIDAAAGMNIWLSFNGVKLYKYAG